MWKVTAFLSRIEKLPPAAQDYWKKSFGVAPAGALSPKGEETTTAITIERSSGIRPGKSELNSDSCDIYNEGLRAPGVITGAAWKEIMPTDIVMPQMGESIFEGTITKWLKKPGDKVQRDEPLFEISTDKVDAEIPAPASGVLQEIKVAEGTTVQVNTVVGTIAADGEARCAAKAAPAAPRQQAPAPSKRSQLQPAALSPQPLRSRRAAPRPRTKKTISPLLAAGPQNRARAQHRSRAGHRHRHSAGASPSRTSRFHREEPGSLPHRRVPPRRLLPPQAATPALSAPRLPFPATSCP